MNDGLDVALAVLLRWCDTVLVGVVVVAAGCGSTGPAAAGDCLPVLTFEGRSYLAVNMDEAVPAGEALGAGTARECVDTSPAPDRELLSYEVELVGVVGVPVEDAVASGQSLYVQVEDTSSALEYGSRLADRAEALMATALQAVDDPSAAPSSAVAAPDVSSDGASCVETMTTANLAGRAFGFDGTVRTVAPAAEVDVDADPHALPSYPVAQFEVHEWFAGGSGDLVSVMMQRAVAPGQRLLVSGEPLFGENPLDDPIAWECGFTVEHSDATAEAWRAAW